MPADEAAQGESLDLRSVEESLAQRSVPGRSLGASVSSLSADGPGNKAIATTLLEWLSVQGRFAERERAFRALEEGEAGVFAHSDKWLAEGAIESLFAAGRVEEGLARALGARLVEPDAMGLRLYGLGLATPEKAYRRVQSLLPRESRGGRWDVEEIKGQGARLRYVPVAPASPGAGSAASLCALRRGMLEAIPGLYGLLPAEIEEKECAARGGEACCYAVRWQTTSRIGLLAGLISGVACAVGLLASHFWIGASLVADASGAGLSATILGVLAALVSGPALGAFWDARAQLAAVAGGRRGQLALLDQVDDALAEKLDALARAEEKTEPLSVGAAASRASAENGAETARSLEDERAIQHAAHQIHTAAGDLACWFESGAQPPGEATHEGEEWGLVRDIREWAARIAELGAGEASSVPQTVDLARLVERAVATARPGLPTAARIEIDAASDLPTLECEPVQIEHVVIQLLRNAVEASVELSETPEVRIVLSKAPHGLELAVEDRGVGIESSEIDEVFDPFFGSRLPGAAGGLGLTVCLRIIERHGGELRIENQARAGTRVTVVLPTKGAPPRSSDPITPTSEGGEM